MDEAAVRLPGGRLGDRPRAQHIRLLEGLCRSGFHRTGQMDDGAGPGQKAIQSLWVGEVTDHGLHLGKREMTVSRDAPGEDADWPAVGRQSAYKMSADETRCSGNGDEAGHSQAATPCPVSGGP